ncbi:MAG: hypothetical protein U1E43_00940 [Rhodospirillales bacterium]
MSGPTSMRQKTAGAAASACTMAADDGGVGHGGDPSRRCGAGQASSPASQPPTRQQLQ